jgi:hypothetical protein
MITGSSGRQALPDFDSKFNIPKVIRAAAAKPVDPVLGDNGARGQ